MDKQNPAVVKLQVRPVLVCSFAEKGHALLRTTFWGSMVVEGPCFKGKMQKYVWLRISGKQPACNQGHLGPNLPKTPPAYVYRTRGGGVNMRFHCWVAVQELILSYQNMGRKIIHNTARFLYYTYFREVH